jgi:hypothetical protein
VRAISSDRSLGFGFCVCPDIVLEPWKIADAATDAVAERCDHAVLAG